MKKFFAVLLVILAGAMPLRADDAADVKAVILKEWTLFAKGDFAEALPLFTKDYRGHGKFNYEQTKKLFLALDGKHLEEWMFTLMVMYKGGGELSPEEAEECRAVARQALQDPLAIKKYEAEVGQASARMKELAKFTLENHKFVSVKVDGDSAVAEIVLESKPGEPPRRSRPIVIRLRRLDGAWRISEDVEI